MSPRKAHTSGIGQQGFTLLEIVIVLAVFSVLSVMAYGGLRNVLDMRRGIDDALSRTTSLQRAYLRMRDDFEQIAARPIRDEFGEVRGALVFGSDGIIEFTRSGWRNPAGLPRPSAQRVQYRREEDRLVRSSWLSLDRAQDARPVDVTVLDKVQEVRWRALSDPSNWQDTWPPGLGFVSGAGSSDPELLPLAVELEIETEDLDTLRLVFRLQNGRIAAPPAAGGQPGTNNGGIGGNNPAGAGANPPDGRTDP